MDDDLDAYNGDAVHDMWVDFDSYVNGLPLENAGIPDVFYEGALEDYYRQP